MHNDVYTNNEKQIMLKAALDSIRYGVEHHAVMPIKLEDYSEALRQERATFVTLELQKELKGCIGTLEARQPLIEDIVYNAYAAAFEDPRFYPVQKQEVDFLEIHISILSEPEPMSFKSEADLLQQICPGIDGLILTEGGHRGTFLPSVWEELKEPQEFLRHLKVKAGLPMNYWSSTIKMERYTAQMIEK